MLGERDSLLPDDSLVAKDVYKRQSLVLKKLLENVVKNIGRNYIPRPYNYEGYFEYGVEVNDGEKKFKEAIVDIYDSEGYKRSNVEQTFKALNYNFSQVRRSGESGSAVDGLIYFDDIITADRCV